MDLWYGKSNGLTYTFPWSQHSNWTRELKKNVFVTYRQLRTLRGYGLISVYIVRNRILRCIPASKLLLTRKVARTTKSRCYRRYHCRGFVNEGCCRTRRRCALWRLVACHAVKLATALGGNHFVGRLVHSISRCERRLSGKGDNDGLLEWAGMSRPSWWTAQMPISGVWPDQITQLKWMTVNNNWLTAGGQTDAERR